MTVPPCGFQHQPREQFFARYDPKQELSGAAILSFIVAIPVALSVLLSFELKSLVPAAIGGGLGAVFLGFQFFELWRANKSAGIFADDVHVGKIDIAWGRVRRKVWDRKAVYEVQLNNGALTVVGVDGSTLFSSGLTSAADQQRFADFIGGKTVVAPPPQDVALAVPPVRTPEGILPLRVRRAAGLLQIVGGLMLGLGVVNIPLRIATTPEKQWALILELCGTLIVYGAVNLVLGLRLARGLHRSREMALVVNPVVTVGLLVGILLASGFPPATAVFAVLFVPVSAVTVFWLREPLAAR